MQYHANSFVLQNFKVNIVGFQGSKGIPSLQDNPDVSFTFLGNSPKKPLWLPGVFYYVFKTIYQVLQLLILLIFVVEKPGHFLVQNPPAIPALAVVWLICCLKGSQFIIDWHNYAFTILSLNIKSKRHPLVRFSKFYEGVFGRMSDKNICVTEAMKNDLETKWNVTANVLYDKPPEFFKETELQEKHDLFKKLSKSYCLAEIFHSVGRSTVFTLENENNQIQYKDKRPALIISSTSWTDDEDFSILLNSLEIYEKEKIKQALDLPNLICVITGKGPLKEYYLSLIKEKDFQFIKIATPWLETEDYPKLIGSGDLGICLHTSSSGLDLPMKVVDMFGCGLPVCAVKYPCLHELVKHDKNGLTYVSPFLSCFTSSCKQGYFTAHTGKPQPNMSTTFIGRSSPDDEVCKHIPKSPDPINFG